MSIKETKLRVYKREFLSAVVSSQLFKHQGIHKDHYICTCIACIACIVHVSYYEFTINACTIHVHVQYYSCYLYSLRLQWPKNKNSIIIVIS